MFDCAKKKRFSKGNLCGKHKFYVIYWEINDRLWYNFIMNGKQEFFLRFIFVPFLYACFQLDLWSLDKVWSYYYYYFKSPGRRNSCLVLLPVALRYWPYLLLQFVLHEIVAQKYFSYLITEAINTINVLHKIIQNNWTNQIANNN